MFKLTHLVMPISQDHEDHEEEINCRRIGRTRLAFLTMRQIGLWTPKLFLEYFNLFLQCAFPSPQKRTNISRGTHIREIQAFQNFFKVIYNPQKLGRTVTEAAQVLK